MTTTTTILAKDAAPGMVRWSPMEGQNTISEVTRHDGWTLLRYTTGGTTIHIDDTTPNIDVLTSSIPALPSRFIVVTYDHNNELLPEGLGIFHARREDAEIYMQEMADVLPECRHEVVEYAPIPF